MFENNQWIISCEPSHERAVYIHTDNGIYRDACEPNPNPWRKYRHFFLWQSSMSHVKCTHVYLKSECFAVQLLGLGVHMCPSGNS